MNAHEIQRAAVLGAGTMGHGIAQVLAMRGVRVNLFDVNAEAVQKGLAMAAIAGGAAVACHVAVTTAAADKLELASGVEKFLVRGLISDAEPKNHDVDCARFLFLGFSLRNILNMLMIFLQKT